MISRCQGLLGLPALPLGRPTLAQSWPSRPVRFVVPYGAGNQAGLVARVLAEGLGAR